MLFNSVSYLVFLAIVVALYWVAPRRHRIWLLLAASLVFYGLWRFEFVLLITFSAWIDYFFSLRIHAATLLPRRRSYLIASLSTNLLLLLYFKYTYFIVDNIAMLGALAGHRWKIDPGVIVLPLGISFYTFLSISYTVDVYRRLLEPVTSFPRYLTYVMFWPHMIAGPILRAHELLPQLANSHPFLSENFARGIRYIVIGLFLKVTLADNISPLVDAAFETPPRLLGGVDVLTMAYGFGFQIYFDFAGYSMIAIGSALLLGVKFPENFNWPYLATSPRDFWKRWHITLSSWIRDYLYSPLCNLRYRDQSEGGLEIAAPKSRNIFRTTIALFLAWFIMGLWHGASWRFGFWGLWHASFIFLYRAVSPRLSGLPPLFSQIGGWGFTLMVAMLGWIPFRAHDLPTALALYGRLFDLRSYAQLGFRENFYLVTSLILVGMLALRGMSIVGERVSTTYSRGLRAIADTVMLSSAMFLVFIFLRPISQFIYFQF